MEYIFQYFYFGIFCAQQKEKKQTGLEQNGQLNVLVNIPLITFNFNTFKWLLFYLFMYYNKKKHLVKLHYGRLNEIVPG